MNDNIRVSFHSRYEAKKILNKTIDTPIAVISINDTIKESDEMHDIIMSCGCDGKTFVFKDLDDKESGFNEKIAKDIIRFINLRKRKDVHFLVHCFAGISRSAAVAKFINTYLGINDPKIDRYNQHNRFIYNVLTEASGKQTLRSFYESLQG